MHRVLTVTALALIATGLELSTEALSTVAARLVAGARALAQGNEAFVSPLRYLAGVGFVTVGFGILGVWAWAWATRDDVNVVGVTCPRCGTETKRVRRRARDRMLGVILGEPVTRRRCGKCAWSGLAGTSGAGRLSH